jgi:hypothetical protein
LERWIQHFIAQKEDQTDLLFFLNVVDVDSNLAYHISTSEEGGRTHHRPVLYPFDYQVPKSHWRLVTENGRKLDVGQPVKTFREDDVELIWFTPPTGFGSQGEVTCVDRYGRKNWWFPQVIRAAFEYTPPPDEKNREALRWAQASEWKPPASLTIVAKQVRSGRDLRAGLIERSGP